MVSSKYGPSSGSGLSKIARIRKVPSVRDRKSTRLNSSHSQISYAVFCLKKKKNEFKGIILGTVETLYFANPIYQIVGTATWLDRRIPSDTPFGTVATQLKTPKCPSSCC